MVSGKAWRRNLAAVILVLPLLTAAGWALKLMF